MKKIVNLRIYGKIGDLLIFVEHPSVYTVGRDGGSYPERIGDIPVYYVERGGDITYHGPGQIVGYPIIKLDERSLSIKDLILLIEESIINTMEHYGLQGYWIKGHAGVWVNGRKIASIGIAVRKWVTYHGFAFNVNNDLKPFLNINPCGLPPEIMTSLSKEVNRNIDINEVKRILLAEFSRLLGEKISILPINRALSLISQSVMESVGI